MSLDVAAGLLRCPHCGSGLTAHGSAWACSSGHSFDVARQGYLNLSGAPEPANADTAAMLDARDRVQAAGVFGFVHQVLGEAVPDTGEVRTLLEVGAGAGHYLAGLVEVRRQSRGVALDVSRTAARRAAKAHARVASVVADVWRGLPVRTASIDLLLCVFAPRNPAEFARVLTPAGRVVVVTPTEDHLAELRRRHDLLGIESDKAGRLHAGLGEFLAHDRTTTVRRQSLLSAGLQQDLIAMGPNAFHLSRQVDEPMRVTLAVEVHVFKQLTG